MFRAHTAFPLVIVQLALGVSLAIYLGYIFRNVTNDFMQYESDAAYFYEEGLASGESLSNEPLTTFVIQNEDILPIATYRMIYTFCAMVGLHPDPIYGIVFNAVLVLLSELLIICYAIRRFNLDVKEQVLYAGLLASNGMLMMFAGIHMRDAFPLFTTTVSIIAFHPKTQLTLLSHSNRLFWLITLMLLSFLCRVEGCIIPLVIYMASLWVSQRAKGKFGIAVAIASVVTIGVYILGLDLFEMVTSNIEAYQKLSMDESSTGSIAYLLLYNIPFPMSLIMSFILLLYIKIPIWRGLFYDSYSFYVSISSIQMLMVAPVFLTIVFFAATNRIVIEQKYLLLCVLAIFFMTAMTSKQIRHAAIIYPAMLLLVVLRDRIIPKGHWRRWMLLGQRVSVFGVLLISILLELRA